MLRKCLTAAMVVTVMLAAFAAEANAERRMHRHGSDIACLASELGLSDEQLSKIRSYRMETRKSNVDIEAEIKKTEIELQELWSSGVPSEKEVDKLMEKIGTLKTKKSINKARCRIKEMKVLDENQLQKYQQLRIRDCLRPDRPRRASDQGPRMPRKIHRRAAEQMRE
jgi:septal ring factor EnvC (AmiA/AmiB activator)